VIDVNNKTMVLEGNLMPKLAFSGAKLYLLKGKIKTYKSLSFDFKDRLFICEGVIFKRKGLYPDCHHCKEQRWNQFH
jgi:hypothetical protein